ncbi:MAG TPA: TAXI family TRAP transporter solute-binding subunit [Enteractinococcus sp.]
MPYLKRSFLPTITVAAALTFVGCSTGGGSGDAADRVMEKEGMPSTMVWSTYGTGTSTYADVAVATEAISRNEDSAVRVITSDTAIGRLAPLSRGQAHFSRTGDEYIFAFEGEYEFVDPGWGPQDLRVAWAPVAPHGLAVPADSDIESIEDLQGSDFPTITANPSVNNKLEAFLAYGGLTPEDTNQIELGYGEQPDAVDNGQLDVLFQQVYGPSLYELEATTPIRWLELDEDDTEKVGRLNSVAPSTFIGEFSGAPGQEDEVGTTMYYPIPVVTYADMNEPAVYETITALIEHYDEYKDSTATADEWGIDNIAPEPIQVPFHEGLIRVLKEHDLWTPEAQVRQDQLVERGEALRQAWDEIVDDTDPSDLREVWEARKAEIPLPDHLQ